MNPLNAGATAGGSAQIASRPQLDIQKLLQALMGGGAPTPPPGGPAMPQPAQPVGPQGAPLEGAMDPFPVPSTDGSVPPDLASLLGNPQMGGAPPSWQDAQAPGGAPGGSPFPVPSTDGSVPPQLASLLGNPEPQGPPGWADAAVGGGAADDTPTIPAPRAPGRSIPGRSMMEDEISASGGSPWGEKSRSRVMPDPGLELLRPRSNPIDEMMAGMGGQGTPEMGALQTPEFDLSGMNSMPDTSQTPIGEKLPMTPEQRKQMLAQLFGLQS